nr:leucine-rich repeat protein 1-like [Leptinotarsa decemlineata]
MKIVCNVSVGNRQLPINKPKKHVKSTLALCKNPNSGDFCIILFNGHNKNGTKYNLKGNVKQVLTKFASEGKCTVQFKIPEHDLYISCDAIQLKGFLHLFKRVLENKVTSKELTVSSLAVTPVRAQDMAPRKLIITKRSDYPSKGFPRTLEELHINDIGRCGVDVGIFHLTKLRVLDLSSNCIEFVPEELNILPNLKELNLSANRLHKATFRQWSWMRGNLAKSLVLLNLSHNELVVLPNQIRKLHQLQTLNLNYNSLQALPTSLGSMSNLKIFSASNNSIKSLPGSLKKLRLQSIDVSHNNFLQHVPHRPADVSCPLRVCSLKEYASRKVLGARLPYPPGSLPVTVINYLDDAGFCVCGKACLEVFVKSSHNLMLTTIAESVSTSVGEKMFVPIDCYFCSLKCYNFALQTRTRHPIVR